ncbi:MAG: class I SAM-dependent methyltransferase [Ardenticatenaceae bacterium]|nr:class I SAM-dependent methyltransferase [Ardenticatenaceae bacterium]
MKTPTETRTNLIRHATFSELLAQKIIKLITSISDVGSSRLIEIGCGTGILAGMLAPKISELVGIDTAPQCIELAKRTQQDLTNIKFLVQSANAANSKLYR